MTGSCENCLYYDYDDYTDTYECIMNLDEDEYYRILTQKRSVCPYFRFNDEYKIVNKQI